MNNNKNSIDTSSPNGTNSPIKHYFSYNKFEFRCTNDIVILFLKEKTAPTHFQHVNNTMLIKSPRNNIIWTKSVSWCCTFCGNSTLLEKEPDTLTSYTTDPFRKARLNRLLYLFLQKYYRWVCSCVNSYVIEMTQINSRQSRVSSPRFPLSN